MDLLGREEAMARRQLLTEEERRALLGVPADPDALVRHFTLSQADQELVAGRRGDANRLGFAVQLALLRHPGTALAKLDQPPEALVDWMAAQLDIPASAFAAYARRPQTMTDHARRLAAALGLRPPTDGRPAADDRGRGAGSLDHRPRTADRGGGRGSAARAGVILPAAAVIERAAIAGRARARKRAAEALLAGLTAAQVAELDGLLAADPRIGMTPVRLAQGDAGRAEGGPCPRAAR